MKKPTLRKRPEINTDRKIYSYYGGNRPSKETPLKVSRFSYINRVLRSARRWSVTRWIVVLVLFTVIGSFIWVDTTPIIRVNNGNRPAREISLYRESAHKILSESILNRTKLTFDYAENEKKITDLYPEISDISISFDLVGRKPVVQLSFHPAAVKVNTKGTVWVVDDRGVAIAKESDDRLTASRTTLPVIEDTIGIGGEVGKAILSESDVSYIVKLSSLIAAKQLTAPTLTIPLVPKEIDVQLTGEGYRTKFNLDEDVNLQVGTWLASRETLTNKGDVPSEYLDIRAGEKVFWK